MAKINQQVSDSYRNNTSSEPIGAISKRDYLLIRILREVGCTVSELVNIKVEDIYTNSIIVGKQRRHIEISIGLREEIKNYLKKSSSEFLFSTRQSPKLEVRRVQQIVKKYLGTKPSKIRNARIIEITEEKGIKKAKNIFGLKGLKIKSFLNKNDIKKLRDNIIDKRHFIAFNTLLESGCLVSELVNIKVEDIKKYSISIGISKREVRISNELLTSIREFISEENIKDFIFTTRQSGRISDKRIFQILKKYGKNTGIELNQRILRNTKLAMMLQAKEDNKKIKDELGIKRLEFGSYGLLNKNG